MDVPLKRLQIDPLLPVRAPPAAPLALTSDELDQTGPMDLTVASGFKAKPPFQPDEADDLPDRLPSAGAAPPSPQPEPRFSLEHTDSAYIPGISPPPPLNSSHSNAPNSSSLLDEDFRPESNMEEDFRPESNMDEDYRPGTNLHEDYRPGTNLHEDYRAETHLDNNYRPQTNLDEDYRSETNTNEDCRPETNVDNDYRPETNMYDPFSPTECEKEERAAEAEDAVADKYDPFEPTGSPVSDNDVSTEELKEQVERSQVENSERSTKLEEPPDSTEAMAESPQRSPDLLSIRRTVDCTAVKEERTDSEHSEIEEGEIVGLLDREAGIKRAAGEAININSPNSAFFGPKPERILRVLDGDGFVSVRADPDWQPEREPDEEEPEMGVEDLRRKLVSRRKERYITFPGATALSPETEPATGHPHSPPPSPAPPALEEDDGKAGKASKSANESDKSQKSKDRKGRSKEERRKKKRKEKRSQRKSKEKAGNHKSRKDSTKAKRSNRSRSSKRKKRRHSPAGVKTERAFSKASEERQQRESSRQRDRDTAKVETRHRSRDRNRDRERSRDRHRERERSRERNRERSRSRDRDRHWDRERARDRERERDRERRRSQRNDDGSPKDRARKRRRDSRSRERDAAANRSRRSADRNDGQRDRERRGRDGRPVVPPSIQELNGSDLYAIKRTITVTTTTTTTTVPGSPRHDSPSDMDKSHRKKKRKGRSSPENERSRRSRSRSLSPRYRNYESDRYSDKLDIDVLSLDGEALDSDYDYPSLEDSPPPAPPPLPLPSPKTKPASKSSQLKRKSAKKNSESSRTKSKNLSATSDPVSSGLPGVKRARKIKDKTRDKGSRKELGRSGKSKKDGSSRKGKLQSKVSVLVREGVSSTTGSSGKLGMDLLGSGGPGAGPGSSVVGGSIAVVFCRDNESRSPFLKPCSEPLSSLGGRGKDLGAMVGKRSSLAAPPNSSSSAAVSLPSQKPGSITSTSSSASSPSSSLVTKRRRRVVKKTRDKVGSAGSKMDEGSQCGAVWGSAMSETQAAQGEALKPASPHHAAPTGSLPCSSSSSSSSTSVLPPSSSPPPSPPPLLSSSALAPPLRESSPDSQTVDSSCKTPEPSFLLLPEEPHSSQTSPAAPSLSPSLMIPGLGLTPGEPPKAPCSPPPCPSSSGAGGAGVCGLSSLSLDPSSSSVSSSSANKPPPPPPPPAAPINWGLQTGVDCTAGGVLALTALLFKMEEANIASRAKAQEFIQATSQILSQANQNQSTPLSSSASQAPPPPSIPPPPRLSPTQLFLHNSAHLHPCAQTPPPISLVGGDSSWENDSKDPDKYLKKLHTQERAVEEVKLAIKPYYQRKDINKDEYKDILRKAVHKICHSRTGEINPVKVSNLVKLYVQRYKYFRKHGRKMDDDRDEPGLHSSA